MKSIAEMSVAEALHWASLNCTPETVSRLRSRRVAQTLSDEVRRLTAEVSALRSGDVCARQCEGQAYRHEALALRKENKRMTALVGGRDDLSQRLIDAVEFLSIQAVFGMVDGWVCVPEVEWNSIMSPKNQDEGSAS